MSTNDSRTANTDATGPRGIRGGRAPRGRNRGRGFHFSLKAHMALTQHLMRRRHCLRPTATDAISLTIGNFHDAPPNARKLDKNVYPLAATRDNILETDPIYLYPPSARQDL